MGWLVGRRQQDRAHVDGTDVTVPSRGGLGLFRCAPAYEAVGVLAAGRQDAARSRRILPQAWRAVHRAWLSTCLDGGDLGQDGASHPVLTPPPPLVREPLPSDVAALTERVEKLELQNRLEREKTVRLTVELDEAKEELDQLRAEQPSGADRPGWFRQLTGWVGAKLPRIAAPPKPDRQSEIEIRIGNCLQLIEQADNIYDAIATDAPYSISLHGYAWDSTEISFSPELWSRLFRVLKPGGYVAFFAAPAALSPSRRRL